MIKARYLAVVPLLLLAACGKGAPDRQVQAGGEILPGSASDAMLPLDTVTSAPPLAPRVEKVPGVTASEAGSEAPTPADAPVITAEKPEG